MDDNVARALIIFGVVAAIIIYRRWWNSLSEEEKRTRQHGPINPALMCPHCHDKGQVRTQAVDQRKGIDGTKAAAGLFTGGLSLLLTGLSRHEHNTQAHCDNCNSTWVF